MSHHSMVGDDPMMGWTQLKKAQRGVPVGAVDLAAVLETEPLIE